MRVVYIRKSAHGLHPPPKKSWIRHCNKGTEESLQIQDRLAKLLLEFFFENGCASASQPLLNWPIVITARKRSCGKVIFIHMSVSHSVHRGVLCMMSLPVWLPGPMFLLWSHAPSRVLCAGGPLDREYPGQKTPGQRAPWIETPLYSKERAIRILLEYILVGYFSLLIFLQFH